MTPRFWSSCRIGQTALLWLALLSVPSLASAQSNPDALPLVYVLATGGTIAGTGDPGALTGYVSGTIPGDALVRAVPQIAEHARVVTEQIANVESSLITAQIWIQLTNRIHELFEQTDPRVAGVVVTHGTWTLEETAYFLNLTVRSDRPVVVVGSQRPPTALSADGPLNLLNAVRVAADPGSVGRGVMVVLNEEINAAREVTKSNTYRVEAFRSGELGFLGYVDADQVVFYRSSTRRHTKDSEFDVRNLTDLPRVGIVMSHTEATRLLVDALVADGYEGVILHGHGSGVATPDLRQGLRDAARTLPVVRTAQAENSRVLDDAGWLGDGILSGDNLSPLKARILLRLALAHTRDPAEIRRIFSQY
jgi:L-asparaginase